MMRFNIIDIVLTTMFNHPNDCLFRLGAIDRIIDAGMVCEDKNGLVDVIAAAFEKEEVYCPHERIDRRQEFHDGVSATQLINEWYSRHSTRKKSKIRCDGGLFFARVRQYLDDLKRVTHGR